MNEQQQLFENAATALRLCAVKSVEGFVSKAVGQDVQITSGPAGQVVVGPSISKPGTVSRILVPLLVGAAVVQIANSFLEEGNP